MTDWLKANEELADRIREHPAFPRLVKAYGGRPEAKVPSRRAARLATRICDDLDLNPAIYRGNVFGAAADHIRATAG